MSSFLLFPLCELTFQSPEPLCQSILAAGAKTVALLFSNDLHAVGFTAGYGIDLNGIDDVGEGYD